MNKSSINPPHKNFWPSFFTAGLFISLSLPVFTANGQEVSENFDLGADPGWQHYTPTTAGGAIPQYSFPNNGSGKGYRMFGPPATCQAVLQRGGSYRSEQ